MRKFTAAFTLLFLLLLALDVFPPLRGGAGWRWPYRPPEAWGAVGLLAGLVGLYVLVVALLRRRPSTWLQVLWAITGTVGLTLAALSIQGDPLFLLFARTASPVQTGASTVAVRSLAMEGVHATLADWPQVMEDAQQNNIIHFTTHPPGQPLVHYWAAQALDDAPLLQDTQMQLRGYQCSNENVMAYTQGEIMSVGLVGMLMPLWAALAVIPLFLAARLLTGHAGQAARLTQWWALVPSILLFTPTWNTLYPALCVLSFYLVLRGLKGERPLFSGLAGLVLGATTLLSFAVLPVGLLLGLFILGWWWVYIRRPESWRLGWPARHGLLLGGGVAALWGMLWAYSGVSPADIFLTGIANHREIVQRANDLLWIFLHLYDFFLFAGWPLVALFGAGVMWAFRQRKAEQGIPPVALLGMILAVTMILIALSGTAQGETARLLTFYLPFMLLVAAPVLDNGRFDLPLLALQGVVVVVLAALVPVMPLDLNPPPSAPRQDVPAFDPLPLLEVNQTFASPRYAGVFVLESYRYIPDVTNRVISLETRWRGQQPTERPYQFEIVATAENSIDGQIATEPFRWYPQGGNYQTPCWQPRDHIRDVVLIPLPVISEPVQWTLHLQAVDARTGERLPTAPVSLGPIPYP